MQGAFQFVDLAAQLSHFVVPVPSVVAVVITVVLAIAMFAVVTVGASFHFLGEVMHAGGPQVLDRHHELMLALVAVPIAFMVFPVTMFALALTLMMKMSNFLADFAFHLLGFLVAIVFTQFIYVPLLLVDPALESFDSLVTAMFTVLPVTVLSFSLAMKMLHFLGQFAFHALGFLVLVVLVQFVDAPLLLVNPALEAFVSLVPFVVFLGMFVVVAFAALQVARFLLDHAPRVLRQSPGFLVSACFGQFLHLALSFVGKAPQFLMSLMAFPLLLVDVAHSFFHDPFGFSLQFPGFLVPTFLGQFLDLTGTLLRPLLESLFAVVFTLSMFVVTVTVAMLICPVSIRMVSAIAFPVVIVRPVGFSTPRFLGPDPPYLVTHFLGLLVFALLLEGLDLTAFLAEPLAQLAFFFFGSLTVAFPSFSFFRDQVVGCDGGKQDAEECVCFFHAGWVQVDGVPMAVVRAMAWLCRGYG